MTKLSNPKEIPIKADFLENENQEMLIGYYWDLIHSYMYYPDSLEQRQNFMFWCFLNKIVNNTKDIIECLEFRTQQKRTEMLNDAFSNFKNQLAEVYQVQSSEYEIYLKVCDIRNKEKHNKEANLQQEINTCYEMVRLFLSINERHYIDYGKYASITLIDGIFSNTRKLVDKNYRAKHYKSIMITFKKYKSVLHIIFAWSFFSQNTQEFDKLTFATKLCFVITIAYDIQEILKQYRLDNSINKFLIDELIEVPADLIKFTRPKSQGLNIKKIIPELKGQELEAYKNYKNYSKVVKTSSNKG